MRQGTRLELGRTRMKCRRHCRWSVVAIDDRRSAGESDQQQAMFALVVAHLSR